MKAKLYNRQNDYKSQNQVKILLVNLILIKSHNLRVGLNAFNQIHQDIAHKGFLKPFEIALKTQKTEVNQNRFWVNNLPIGLKIVSRKEAYSIRYQLKNIGVIDKGIPLDKLQEASMDNLLSLMKRREGIELAICICMYIEDRTMLKNTLAGVEENIQNLVALEGLDPDQIGVFVIMDGIEKVHDSVVEYFEELERSSNIFLGENAAPPLTMQELMEMRRGRIEEVTEDEEELNNINNFLFEPAELEARNQMRFVQVRKMYSERRKLLNKIQSFQGGNPSYQDLPGSLQHFFYFQACKQWKIDFNDSDEQVRKINPQVIVDQYTKTSRNSRALIQKALKEAETMCSSYIQGRQEMAYVGCFRKRVPFSFKNLAKSSAVRQNSEEQQLNQELFEESPHTVMNLFMCVKYKNAKKLSSHNWFLNGFCRELKPKYTVLLDVGLRPEGEALLRMYTRLRDNSETLGGVCGYMSLKIEKLENEDEVKDEEVDFLTNIATKFVDIQKTQQVEYHFAHLMDKAFEAAFGFIHVLPGAFSAYNMRALIQYDSEEKDDLLQFYFKSIDDKIKDRKIMDTKISVSSAILRVCLPDFINSCFITIDPESDEAMLYEQNLNLAEDRILCMGIHKKGENGFSMDFLPNAYAQVDPMKTLPALMGQRKRWTNGSYFAFDKVKKQLNDFHRRTRKSEPLLYFQMLYLTMMNSLAYFSASFYLFTVHIAMESFRDDVLVNVLQNVIKDPNNSELLNAFVYTMDFLYVVLLLTIVFYSLNMKSDYPKFKYYIYAVSTLFGLFMLAVIAVLLKDTIGGLLNNQAFLTQNGSVIKNIPGGIDLVNVIRWMLIGTLGIYLLPILFYNLLYGRFRILWEVVLGFISFLFYSPTYLNILNVYSLCRIDDISWGTKGLDSSSPSSNSLADSWKLIKMVHVTKYVIWNVILSSALLTLGAGFITRFYVSLVILGIIALSFFIKAVVGICYLLVFKCKTIGQQQKKPTISSESRIRHIIDSYSQQITNEILARYEFIKEQFMRNQLMGSFSQASRIRTKKSTYLSQIKSIISSKVNQSKLPPIKKTNYLSQIIEEGRQAHTTRPTNNNTQRVTFQDQSSMPSSGHLFDPINYGKTRNKENDKESKQKFKTKK